MIDALARITELQARIAVQRRQPEARALADEAETRARAAYGAEHPRASFAKIRAWYLRDAASEQDRATLAKLAASAPELWPWALNNYANALLLADRPREVVELLAWARALEEAPAITGTVGQGIELLELAAMIDAGMIDDAARRLDELARTLEPEASIMQRVDFASYRGRIAAARGDWPAAVTHDRDALELYDRMTAEDSLPARLRVSVDLARALLATGERDAAASRLSAALASYRALGQGFAPEIAEVERMLSTGG